ncbi:MAG: hypothetical protein PVG14_05205 [Anaerolineales bacterium]|jgi:hypothetical protein
MKQKQSRVDTFVGIIFPVCLGIGTGIGALIHNVGVGIAIGAAIGTILNLTGYYLIKSNTDQENLPRS